MGPSCGLPTAPARQLAAWAEAKTLVKKGATSGRPSSQRESRGAACCSTRLAVWAVLQAQVEREGVLEGEVQARDALVAQLVQQLPLIFYVLDHLVPAPSKKEAPNREPQAPRLATHASKRRPAVIGERHARPLGF